MRALITGAGGMLGKALVGTLAATDEILPCVFHGDRGLDVRSRDDVARRISQFQPDVVYHLAALTDVDLCERAPRDAFWTNTVGTENVALACREVGCALVYVSTLQVFNGQKPEPYHEYDEPSPINAYGRSKFEGERLVSRLVPKSYVVRAGWMFGGGVADKKFVARIVALAKERQELRVVADKFGSPTYTLDFARLLRSLVESNVYGLYHGVGNGDVVSRAEFSRLIVQMARLKCDVVPVSSAEFPLSAPRPRMEGAINLHLSLATSVASRDWRDALREYLTEIAA